MVLFRHGVTVDTAKLQLKGVSLRGMDFAIVICIFSLVGFESATALGGEARNALRDVLRAVIWGLVITGGFRVVMSYLTRRHPSARSPHREHDRIGLFGERFQDSRLPLGAMVSFFSLTLSCLNAGARIIYPMGQRGFLPKQGHRVHAKNMTPHVAIAGYGGLILVVALVLHAAGTGPVTILVTRARWPHSGSCSPTS